MSRLMHRSKNFRLFDYLVGFRGLGRPLLLPQYGRTYEPVQKDSRPAWKKRELAYQKGDVIRSLGINPRPATDPVELRNN
jgi:hypothetical protein